MTLQNLKFSFIQNFHSKNFIDAKRHPCKLEVPKNVWSTENGNVASDFGEFGGVRSIACCSSIKGNEAKRAIFPNGVGQNFARILHGILKNQGIGECASS